MSDSPTQADSAVAQKHVAQKQIRWWIVLPGILFLILVGQIVLYFSVYFGCSELALGSPNVRIFHSRWLTYYYQPAVQLESWIGKPTKLVYMPPPEEADSEDTAR